MTKEERRAEKRRLQGRGDDDPEQQAARGGTYVVRTSTRWRGRTKGLPFSRCLLKHVIPAHPARGPASLFLKHPTRGRMHVRTVTPQLAEVFYPGAAANPFLIDMLFGKN